VTNCHGFLRSWALIVLACLALETALLLAIVSHCNCRWLYYLPD
jgi:hypothetical protein